MIQECMKCYGCRACEHICPQKAISMQPNSEGFIFPFVDETLCTGCALCEKACPMEKANVRKVAYQKSDDTYAAWNKSKAKVIESTSGGLFATIAEYIISQKGIVYGCAWKKDELVAHHIRVDNKDGIALLKGSKYVQSDTENTFQTVKSDLEQGYTVLYSGTPCQIAGLRLFLRKDYENLITIDLVCHGVPSPKMFSAYINWLQMKRKSVLSDYKFRDLKRKGWRAYNSWMENENKKVMKLFGLQPYSMGFNSSYFNRESCFTCDFSCPERVADITLSDFWGGERHHEELKSVRQFGFNMVMCNTKKGKNVFNAIQKEIICIFSKSEYAIAGDIRLRRPDPRPEFRNDVYKILNDKGFDYLQKHYLRTRLYWIQKFIPDWIRHLKHVFK